MYELIQHQRLESAASSITFSDIPQIYTDLCIVISARNVSTQEHLLISCNGSTADFTGRYLSGNAAGSPGSGVYARYLGNQTRAAYTANTFGNAQIYITNYSSSTTFKSISSDTVAESNDTSPYLALAANLWANNSPITSLSFTSETGSNFAQFTSATLYGVNRTSGRGRPKAIGGAITYANGYWVHTFTGSGTFSTTQSISVDALVVAGGGAGHGNGNTQNSGDGGSAGQMLQLSGVLLTGPSSIPVLVGSGGPGVAGGVGSTGGASAFGTSQATGGAGGVNQSSSVPRAGGSGAGGPALAPGANTGGDGGPGLPWNGAYYAGGGGGGFSFGGNGGIGGGGRGESYNTGNGAAGTANTGGGGGGKSSTGLNPGYNGGSGVVIIRYRAD